MAIKRLKPIQDTFIVENDSNASFGSDEILELGHCQRFDATGCSRILIEFMVNEVETLLGHHDLIRATLNLKYAYAENLQPVWGIDVTEIESEWAEGHGHVYDLPGSTDGASWFRPKGMDVEEYWNGGLLLDDTSGLNEEEAYEPVWKHEYFTGYQANKDVCLDVTEWVYSWLYTPDRKGLGFLLKLSNEELADKEKTRVCFYGSETHTIYSPFLELVFDDSSIDVDDDTVEADTDKLFLGVSNLKESYYIGEKVKLNVTARPEYPVRKFSTKSLYADQKLYVPKALWGIRDEYTGQMWIPFNPDGTKLSYDKDGNYFILDTDLLEPERYYRLLFEVEREGRRRVYDSKSIFRVTKHGEI